jgi:hypothetical protein
MAPVVPPEPDAGRDLAPYRYGGPRKKNAKRIAAQSEVLKEGVSKPNRAP